MYNNTNNPHNNQTQFNLQSNSQITQHEITQNRVIPRNNNNTLINNHFDPHTQQQRQRHFQNRNSNSPGTPDWGA